jgi:lipoprotein NlpI
VWRGRFGRVGEGVRANAIFLWFGGIFEKQGKRDLARQQYAQSLQIQPGQKDVAEALKRLGG